MAAALFLLVCEGETDFYIFQALSSHFSRPDMQLTIKSLSPQRDATSGTYPTHGFGEVLNWCSANKQKLQMLIDFSGAKALLVQMDTDIAKQANPGCVEQGRPARECCQERLNVALGVTEEPPRCHYVLPTQSTETWILASHAEPQYDGDSNEISDYQLIQDTEQRLIDLGYPSRKGKNRASRKLNKQPASKYLGYGRRLLEDLDLARRRCAELERLCGLFEFQAHVESS
jgi:hypothetical protein